MIMLSEARWEAHHFRLTVTGHIGIRALNMFEVIETINQVGKNGVEVVFVLPPELSTNGAHRKLLQVFCSYSAEIEGK